MCEIQEEMGGNRLVYDFPTNKHRQPHRQPLPNLNPDNCIDDIRLHYRTKQTATLYNLKGVKRVEKGNELWHTTPRYLHSA